MLQDAEPSRFLGSATALGLRVLDQDTSLEATKQQEGGMRELAKHLTAGVQAARGRGRASGNAKRQEIKGEGQ